jgi:hypothetical protein
VPKTETYSFCTSFLAQLVACNLSQWSNITSKLYSDVLMRSMVVFPIQLFKDKWSLFIVASLPWVGKNSTIMPMICYIDFAGRNSYDSKILHMSNKIRQILNVIWRNKYRSKVDKIENPYNHRSLPLRCVNGTILSICCYF